MAKRVYQSKSKQTSKKFFSSATQSPKIREATTEATLPSSQVRELLQDKSIGASESMTPLFRDMPILRPRGVIT